MINNPNITFSGCIAAAVSLLPGNLQDSVIWSTNLAGTFDGQGNVTLTNGILPTEASRFFIIRTP